MDERYSALLDALRGVAWPARRAARGAIAGVHGSRLKGSSPEFTEYRAYRQGDDPRRLDWRLLARTDRAYLRITSDRATLPTVVLVDASASMAFPTDSRAKWEQCRRIAIGLAAVAHATGDPVGVIVPAPSGARWLAPRTRRGVIAEVARLLGDVEPQGDAPLAPGLVLARQSWRVAIISDFLGDADALLRAARERLSAGAEVHAVHLVAREELEPPSDAMLATDPEQPALKRPLVAATRDAYLRAFAVWRSELARSWRAAGASFTEVLADEPTARAVRRIVEPRVAAREGA
jgi:uncharacterized protein (DUF58 family)